MSDYTRLVNEYTEYRKRAYEKYGEDADTIKQLQAEIEKVKKEFGMVCRKENLLKAENEKLKKLPRILLDDIKDFESMNEQELFMFCVRWKHLIEQALKGSE